MKLRWIIAGSAATVGILYQAIRSRRRHQDEGSVNRHPDPSLHLNRTLVIPTAMAVTSIAVWMRVSHGNTLKYTFVPSMVVSWVLYLRFLRRRMPEPDKITAFYLLALAWQLVHFVEENSTGFRYRWPVEIFGTQPYGDRQYVAINALSYAVFLAGGVALLKRRPEFSLPAVFFAVMGVMYNGVQCKLLV